MVEKAPAKMKAADIRVFVAAVDSVSLNNFINLLNEDATFNVIGTALDGEDCLRKLAKTKPDILLAELALAKISGVKVAEYLSLEQPEISTVIVTDQSNLGYYRSAMLAGAREFLITPVTAEELIFSLKRLFALEKERRRKWKNKVAPPPVNTTDKAGRIILTAAGKGGVGRSFVTANLARFYAAEFEAAVVDFDLQFGDMAAVCGVQAGRTLADLVPVADELDRDVMTTVAVPLSERLHVYAAPLKIEQSELPNGHFVAKLLTALRAVYDYTFINTGTLISDIYLDLLENSDYLLLLVNPEVMAVRAAARLRDVYLKLGLSPGTIGLVVNKDNDYTSVKTKKIAELLSLPILARIPFMPREVATLLDEGRLLDNDDSELASAFALLRDNLNQALRKPADLAEAAG